jgi:hypothetical protein
MMVPVSATPKSAHVCPQGRKSIKFLFLFFVLCLVKDFSTDSTIVQISPLFYEKLR